MSETQILVVEDERLVARAIQNELEQFGYCVSGIASSASEAVQQASDSRPDLVLMDINLKGDVDGIEAARRIHTRWGIPVVYLSAFSDAATLARASETEAFGYLLKPYEERELQTTIEMALAKHRAEQRLEETERWLTAIHASIGDGVIATDPENQVRFINCAAEAMTGWWKAYAVGEPVANVCELVDENGRIELKDFAAQVVRESRVLDLPPSTWLVSKDGRETPVEGSLAPIYDARGDFLGTVLTLRNIGPRLESESLRQQSEQRLRRAQKMEAVSRLAGGLSRHLNNLLTVILGNTSLALAELSEAPAHSGTRSLLQEVERAAQNAAELSQRLRMLSLFSGRSPSGLLPLDLNLLIPDCLNQIKPLLNSRILVTFTAGAEPWLVNADELLFGQALLELALNSQHAMPHGGRLTIKLENIVLTKAELDQHPSGQVGEFVRVQIDDNGPGIAPEVRDKLFEPFFNSPDSNKVGGLGMTLVSAVVEQHRGWIECQDQEGHGTRFDLFLPRAGVPATSAGVSATAPKPRGAAQTILLADPDPMVRDLGRRILEAQGYRVLLADDGVQALAIFRQEQEHIDLAILDLDMPRLPTYVVLDRLVEMDPNIRALFTGSYFSEDLTSAQGHTRGVITKPFRQQELVEMVKRALVSAVQRTSGTT